MDCNVQCEFYTDLALRCGACVQVHQPEIGVHFFSILNLGRISPTQIDKSNQWHVGINEILEINNGIIASQ